MRASMAFRFPTGSDDAVIYHCDFTFDAGHLSLQLVAGCAGYGVRCRQAGCLCGLWYGSDHSVRRSARLSDPSPAERLVPAG